MPRKNRRLIYSGNGDAYYVSPSAIGSSELSVTTPEVFVTANPDDVARGRAKQWADEFGTSIEKQKQNNKRERNIAKEYFASTPTIGNIFNGLRHLYNSVPYLGGERENGLEYNTGITPTPGIKNFKSLSKLDREYFKALNEGNISKARKLVAKAFNDKSKNTSKFSFSEESPRYYYHTTNSDVNDIKSIDLNRTGQNWEESKRYNRPTFFVSAGYPDKYWGDNVLKLFIKSNKPKLVKPFDTVKGVAKDYDAIAVPKYYQDYIPEVAPTRGFKSYPKEGLYTSEEYPNIFNNPDYKSYFGDDIWYKYNPRKSLDSVITPYGEVGVFNPNNVKSANIVTYDDYGNIIPLSKRFNFDVNDIRYGLLPLGIGLTGYGLNQKRLGGRVRLELGGKTDNENNEGLFGNETIDNVTSYLPILGTVQDAYNLYKNPSWENAGWLALSLAGDLAGFGVLKGVKAGAKAVKAARKTEKAAKEALDTHRKINRNIIARSIREEDRKLVENYNKAQVDRALKEGENFWHKATVYPISGAISTYDAAVNYTQNKSNKKRYGGKVRLLSAYD